MIKMDTRLNEWRKLNFVDPPKILPQLRIIQLQVASSTLNNRVKDLRTHQLKRHREGWEAALFCYGMSKMIGVSVYVAPYEASDYDAVAVRKENDTQYDAKVIFHPIDYIVFNGMKGSDSIKNIVFLDRIAISPNHRQLQKSIGRVIEKENYEWLTLRVREDGCIIEE